MSEPREIPNHTTRSVVAASGCGAMVFGSLFLAVGLGMLALVSNRYAEMPQEKGLLAAAGLCLVFAGAGGLFVTQGARGIAARRRRKRLLAENPGEPWLADHAWSGPSLDADRRGGILHGLGCIAVSCLFLAPFNWWAFASGDASLPLQAVVGLVDLGPIVLLAGLAYEQARRARWGRARLELDAFPLFVGERLTARLVPARSLVKGTLELTLRCVEERHEARRSGNRTSNVVVAYAHHEARHAVDLATAPGETRVSFDLPRDGPATRLSSDPPTYWELLAKAETPGIDFEETFLLPVYKRGETLA
ncbi:MAG TPA: hypothetical protein VFM88_06575 [Vicinamibacteria bacterium]|nr:hypothetical protein [Vicinamibacteria bacterium]